MNGILASNVSRSSGFMITEIIIALFVLGFIIHPVFVHSQNKDGTTSTRIEWEVPFAQMFAQLGDLGAMIDHSWTGLDHKFGYKGAPMGAQATKLMSATLQNGIVMMTAGFLDKQGRITTDFQHNAANFEDASKGFVVATYNAAMQGMYPGQEGSVQ